jgi:hypothetical protein
MVNAAADMHTPRLLPSGHVAAGGRPNCRHAPVLQTAAPDKGTPRLIVQDLAQPPQLSVNKYVHVLCAALAQIR